MSVDFSPGRADAPGASNKPCPRDAEATFRRALELHQQGEEAEAAVQYRQTLALCPERAEAWFWLGVLHGAAANTSEALDCLERAQALMPREPAIAYQLAMTYHAAQQHRMAIDQFQKTLSLDPAHWQAAYNLGTVLLGQGRIDEAIAAYRTAAGLNPGDADIHFNLGLACKRAGKPAEAVAAYLRAAELAPDDAEVHYNLGLTYKAMGCIEEATAALEIAIAIQPDYTAAHGNLGVLYLDQGRVDAAAASYQRLVDLDHNVEAARHILAALSGETTSHAPSGYIADLFDNFSATFEQRLVGDLGYQAPWQLKKMLLSRPDGKERYESMLDLGCGTGLVGEALQEITGRRVGVDLSPRMIEAAAAKKLYDRLTVAEITAFLEQTSDCFDLIVAADVLIYVGELEDIFPLLARRLARGGRLLFSTEHLAGTGYQLRQSGRYAHATEYIRAIAGQSGLTVLASEQAPLRREKGEWLAGEFFVLGHAGETAGSAAS
ncbi:MAG: tetratricopeptide repeat protein [Thermodesulfobacteriota bacterium]